MNKRSKFLTIVVVLNVIVVFLIFYLRDDTDVTKIEKAQDASAEEKADDLLENLNASFEDIDFDEETESDSL